MTRITGFILKLLTKEVHERNIDSSRDEVERRLFWRYFFPSPYLRQLFVAFVDVLDAIECNHHAFFLGHDDEVWQQADDSKEPDVC